MQRALKQSIWFALLSAALGFGLSGAFQKSAAVHARAQDDDAKALLAVIDGMALHIEEGRAGRPYDAYMSLPLELCREVHLRLTPETKAAVWKAHFQYCLASLPLTPRQQESVRKADELITAESYGPFADLRRLVNTVESSRPWFEPALFAFVFYGEEPAVGGQGRGLFALRPDPRLQSAAGCNCRTYKGRALNCGGGVMDGQPSRGRCSETNSCGPGGAQTCDGLCS